jgi:hypothetical protein
MMREWDCGSFDSSNGRFWNRLTVKETPEGYQVLLVSYDRDAGMRKTEQLLGTFPSLETARTLAWQFSKGRR